MTNYQINYKKIILLVILLTVALAFGWLLYRMFIPTDKGPITPPGTGILTPDDTSSGLPGAGVNTGGQIINTPDSNQLPDTDSPTTTSPPTNNIGGTDNTITRDNKITSLTNHRVSQPILNKDGSGIQYYNPLDDHFYRLDSNGQAELLSDKTFADVKHVAWSPQQEQAVLYYPDSSKIIYNFETGQQVALQDNWYDFSWSNTGDKLAFKSLSHDANNNYLAVVNDDGSGSKKIEKIGKNADKVIISWSPNNQVVGLLAEGNSYDGKTIYLIGQNGENFKAIETEGRGFEHQWSPQGDKMIFSTYSSSNDYKPMLWRVDSQGDDIGNNRYPLNIETWASKCTFINNSEAYCAVPQSLDQGSGLFPTTASDTPDNLYHVNLDTGAKILIDSTDYNMNSLMVTSDQRSLYFTDGLTGLLRKIEL